MQNRQKIKQRNKLQNKKKLLKLMEEKGYKLPKNKALYILAKREKIQEKSFLEKASDFLFTFGNEAFKEYYFFIQEQQNGSLLVFQKILINEYNANSFRNIQEFDDTEYIKKQIHLFSFIKKIIESLSQGISISNDQIDQFLKLIGDDDHSEGVLNNLNLIGNIAKAAAISGVSGFKQIISYTSLETFKIVNNALAKEGIKGFMSIGGKTFLQEGAKAAVAQAGKELTKGTVTQVTQNTVTIGKQVVKTGFSVSQLLKGLGIGIAVNVAVGGIKSVIKTKWLNEFEFICECDSEFNFEIIKDFSKFKQKFIDDSKNIEELYKEIIKFYEIPQSKRYSTNDNIKTPQDQEYKEQQQQNQNYNLTPQEDHLNSEQRENTPKT
ncbi:hypothetical protein TTHERM_00816260 (macronuclear) [Tetrahymena thermophila SB210]|uniref:Uncharacterized protein n=1 Tax=Tetrahymena thermophila (strain SB210) TaxID=312017 RepID=Q23HC0_TETTS|nr:hypothetical protein TTHERM_00816260 [Tetrahymena thermophila SB210]EAR95888.2 hypothetical protein TTHERM_00816260 [Tetrahymena thermophila SB210]|eukprot:XP_001016133.2 hypothetical protein TTHERM_00816260 [Tetrahymena thermophila SB210]